MITKTVMTAVIGRPNVGKSTLTNAMVGEKIAIVTSKPQTTRNRIFGIVNKDDTQIILMDTPGFHKARNRLGDYMVKVVNESVTDVDAAVLVVPPVPEIGTQENLLIEKIKEASVPALLVINKIDTVEKDEILAVIAAYSAVHEFDAVIPISAKLGDGVQILTEELCKYAQPGPALFPEDMITDQPERQICAEIIREKLLICLEREVPHGTAVEITKFS